MAYVQTTMERKANWRQVYWPFDSREETYADHRLGFPQPQYPCIFNLLHLHLVPPLGVTHWNFIKFFGIEKLQCMDYHAASVAGSASHHFDRTPSCDGHTMTVYTALAFCHTVRMQPRCTSCNNTYIQQQSCNSGQTEFYADQNINELSTSMQCNITPAMCHTFSGWYIHQWAQWPNKGRWAYNHSSVRIASFIFMWPDNMHTFVSSANSNYSHLTASFPGQPG